MMIAAAVGMANNFGALKSLTTTGIQKGHMKMHLLNILNHFEAGESEKRSRRGIFPRPTRFPSTPYAAF